MCVWDSYSSGLECSNWRDLTNKSSGASPWQIDNCPLIYECAPLSPEVRTKVFCPCFSSFYVSKHFSGQKISDPHTQTYRLQRYWEGLHFVLFDAAPFFAFVTESKNILFQTSKKLNFQISKYPDIESLRIVTNIQITNPYKYPDIEIYSTQKFLCTDAAFFCISKSSKLELAKLPNRVQDF